MDASDRRALAALRVLLRSSHLAGPDDLPALVAAAGRELGAESAVLHLVDYDQVLLVPLLPVGEPAEVIAVDGTLAGRAFAEVAPYTATSGPGPVLWSPVLDGTERLGVLQLAFGSGTEVDDDLRGCVADVSAVIAELVMTRTLYGDAVERTRRRKRMTVPAEMQWRQLPPLTFVGPRVAVAGVLAPAAEVAGDSFDYAVDGEVLHVAVVDAMGHGLEATLLSSVAVAALRNSRRAGLALAETVALMDRTIAAQFGPDRFVTGIVGQLDQSTGWWTWVACGHPAALVVRGGRVVKVLDGVVGAPLGLGLLGDRPETGRERLEPGDRVLLYTDGVVEARDAGGEFFGTERLVDHVAREASAGRAAAETLRRLNLAVLAHNEGELRDDATTVVVEWLSDQAELSTP